MGRIMLCVAALYLYIAIGSGGYVQDRISAYDSVHSRGVLFKNRVFKPVNELEGDIMLYSELLEKLPAATRTRFTELVWDRYGRNRTGVTLSRVEHHIRRECIEILKTNVFAAASCSLPLQCTDVVWHAFERKWFGNELGICYSATNFEHNPSNNLVVLEHHTESMFTVGEYDVVHLEELPFVFFMHDVENMVGAIHLSLATRHPEVDYRGHSVPPVGLRGDEYCFYEMGEPRGELLIDFDHHSLLRKLDPVLLVAPVGADPRSYECDGPRELLFSTDVASFYGSVTRGTVCDAILRKSHRNDTNSNCYKVIESYSDPVEKILKTICKFALKTVTDLLKFLLDDVIDIFTAVLESCLDIFLSLYNKLYELFATYLIKFLVLLCVLYIYDAKFFRDVILSLLFVGFSYLLNQVVVLL